MNRVLAILVLLYLVSLHASMAGMEIFGWLTALIAFVQAARNRKPWSGRAMLWPLVAFVGAAALSLLLNPALKALEPQFGFLRFAVLYFGLTLALDQILSDQFEQRLKNVWLICLSLVGGYGFLQMMTGIDLLPRSESVVDRIGHIWKATGFFNMSLTYAYMVGVSTIAMVILLFESQSTRKWHWLAPMLGGLGILASTARGAWLGAFVSLWVYVVAQRRRWIIPALVATGAALGGLILFGGEFGAKIQMLLNFQLDHSSSVRFPLWQSYLAMFWDHPVFGVGLFQGDQLLLEYYARLGIQETFTSHAHNNFVQMLAGTGIVGFVAYLWMISVPMWQAFRLCKVSAWGWALLMAQVFFHLGGLTEANFLDGEVNHLLVFIWALTAALLIRKSVSPAPSLA